MDPAGFASQEVDDLVADRGIAEAGDVLCVGVGGERVEVIDGAVEAEVGPAVELADAVEGEHGGSE